MDTIETMQRLRTIGLKLLAALFTVLTLGLVEVQSGGEREGKRAATPVVDVEPESAD